MTKEIMYRCNLCPNTSTIGMRSLVKNIDHTKYILSTPEDSINVHVCTDCIKLLNISDTKKICRN